MTKDFLMVRDFTAQEILATFGIALDMKKDRKKIFDSSSRRNSCNDF